MSGNWRVYTWKADAADLNPQVARQGLWFGELWWQQGRYRTWLKLNGAQANSLSGLFGVLEHAAVQQEKQHPELFV